MTIRWYAVQIIPSLQKTAEENLLRQGFTLFVPQLVTYTYNKQKFTEPLFKGYGFIELDIHTQQWRSINGTPGVVKLLPKDRELPLPIRPGLIERFVQEDPLEHDQLEQLLKDIAEGKAEPLFAPGRQVRVTEGRAAGHEGEVFALRGRFAEILFQRISESGPPMLIPLDSLEVVEDAYPPKPTKSKKLVGWWMRGRR